MQIQLSEIPSDFNKRIAVMHVVDRPLEDLTVDDICKRCGISRSKFYEMFKSKYDIGYWYLDLVYKLTLGKIGRTLTWREGIVSCLELMDQERTYYGHTSRTPENVPNLYWVVQGDRVKDMERVLKERAIAISPGLRIQMKLYAELVDKLLRCWVEPNEIGSVEQYADLWISCIPNELYACLESA